MRGTMKEEREVRVLLNPLFSSHIHGYEDFDFPSAASDCVYKHGMQK